MEGLLRKASVILETSLSSVLVDMSVIDEIDLKTSIIDGCEEVRAAEVLAESKESEVFALVKVPLLDEVLDLKQGVILFLVLFNLGNLRKQIVESRAHMGISQLDYIFLA